ncbi:MAG: hypothetical protein QE271_03285 [Bacteriovoracaceae bacterium]|nr:hypothetical protein [Bacteriovoracaceae bacterium]
MKKFLILIALLPALTLATPESGSDSICSLNYLIFSDIVSTSKEHSPRDKNRHCAISCMLTLRCNSVDVFQAGVLKEIYDIFGPGDFELNDLAADTQGILFGNKIFFSKAGGDDECFNLCDQVYPPRSNR